MNLETLSWILSGLATMTALRQRVRLAVPVVFVALSLVAVIGYVLQALASIHQTPCTSVMLRCGFGFEPTTLDWREVGVTVGFNLLINAGVVAIGRIVRETDSSSVG